ncbi:MAG TPA: nitrile hydratase subunit beta [Bryobacteraceae bacterium]|jgi:nitrile hydratase|nr:nitrile hydratase subunit beta [Bryobacteraceae bacterium]
MNGIHDMGGMHGLGPIEIEKDEPVFHHPWEGRVFALNLAARAGKGNLDNSRYGIELLPPADYLRMTYYEKWLARLEGNLVRLGVATEDEIESGKAAPGSPKFTPALTPALVNDALGRVGSARRDVTVAPLFEVDQQVRARNINPTGHTRLPRYARGKVGTIVRDHGVFVFPDTNARFEGEKPQHVYSVRFTARELWGEQASSRDAVYLDLWDDYLERA